MSLFTRSLWPERVRSPYLRLAVAIVAAPAILVAIGTAIAFVIAGASEATEAGTMAVTKEAGLALAVLAIQLVVLAGLPGIVSLWALGQRGIVWWSAAGGIFGAGATIMLAMLQQGVVSQGIVLVGTVFAWLMFLLIRGIAGIRSR